MYDLDYIKLQHSDTHSDTQDFRKHILLPGYFQQILFYYIFSVRVDQNLPFGQNQFARQWVNEKV